MSLDATVPSSPIVPVTHGRSSGSTDFPSSAFAHPACSRSATASTRSSAPMAPAPTSIATLLPALSTSPRGASPSSCGSTRAARKTDARVVEVHHVRRSVRRPVLLANLSGRSTPSRCVRRARRAPPDRWRGARRPGSSPSRDIRSQRLCRGCADRLLADTRCRSRVVAACAADREHGHVIGLRVVESVEQMDRARARSSPRHTPSSPVNFACAHAMNAACSSCRTWTKSIASPASACAFWCASSAAMMPLMPSPG